MWKEVKYNERIIVGGEVSSASDRVRVWLRPRGINLIYHWMVHRVSGYSNFTRDVIWESISARSKIVSFSSSIIIKAKSIVSLKLMDDSFVKSPSAMIMLFIGSDNDGVFQVEITCWGHTMFVRFPLEKGEDRSRYLKVIEEEVILNLLSARLHALHADKGCCSDMSSVLGILYRLSLYHVCEMLPVLVPPETRGGGLHWRKLLALMRYNRLSSWNRFAWRDWAETCVWGGSSSSVRAAALAGDWVQTYTVQRSVWRRASKVKRWRTERRAHANDMSWNHLPIYSCFVY